MVTGGAGGLGYEVSRELANAGARLAVCDSDQQALDQLEADLQDEPAGPFLAKADVRKPDELTSFFDAVADRFGRIDILVTVPGGTFTAPFETTTPKGWDALISLNFTSLLDSIRRSVPLLRAAGGGSIVNITSSEAHRGAPGIAVYAALKSAVESLSRTLAVELSEDRIRVNCVAPDQIPTPNAIRVGAFPPDLDAPRLVTSNAVTIPMGRMGRPSEVSGPVLFLASELASYVTGAVIPVDGGVLAAAGWLRWPEGYSNRLPAVVADALRIDAEATS